MNISAAMSAVIPAPAQEELKRRHDAFYAGKSDEAQYVRRQIADAWNETFSLRNFWRDCDGGDEENGGDGLRLTLAALAEKALWHYWAVARAIKLDPRNPDAMAECCRQMDRLAHTARAVRWSCPPDNTLTEYRWLVGLFEDRARVYREHKGISSR